MAQANHHEHHHHHHGHHGHHEDETLSHDDRNLAHWDKVAKTYNSEHTQKEFGNLITKATEFVLANISSIGVDFLDPSSAFESSNDNSTSNRSIRVLDYACGPGTITNILAGRAMEFIGLDLSPNMVAEYNSRFAPTDSSAEPLNATAFNFNLFDPSGVPDTILTDPKFSEFDLAAVGFGFHHFENLPLCTQRLVDRLKPGGVLMILDFYTHAKEDMADHPAVNTIAHHGFTEAHIRVLFESAGLTDVRVLDFGEDIVMRKHATRRPFMARGRKPVQ